MSQQSVTIAALNSLNQLGSQDTHDNRIKYTSILSNEQRTRDIHLYPSLLRVTFPLPLQYPTFMDTVASEAIMNRATV